MAYSQIRGILVEPAMDGERLRHEAAERAEEELLRAWFAAELEQHEAAAKAFAAELEQHEAALTAQVEVVIEASLATLEAQDVHDAAVADKAAALCERFAFGWEANAEEKTVAVMQTELALLDAKLFELEESIKLCRLDAKLIRTRARERERERKWCEEHGG